MDYLDNPDDNSFQKKFKIWSTETWELGKKLINDRARPDLGCAIVTASKTSHFEQRCDDCNLTLCAVSAPIFFLYLSTDFVKLTQERIERTADCLRIWNRDRKKETVKNLHILTISVRHTSSRAVH